MSSRAAEESSGGVLSFTFLDVLTCTMGSLVLLLVVLGERAKRTAYAEVMAEQAAVVVTADVLAASESDLEISADEAAKELADIRAKQADLEKLRADAVQRLHDEQARVAHLEDHERRLEHELAKLHFTLERLDEAEKHLQVDQAAAQKDLERLTGLVQEAKKRLKEAQSTSQKQRSFAIVPYKGANGTYRRPIYIECTKEAVIIQPEGIRLTAADFDGPLRSGNPLAAAVRAAREELNSRPGADAAAGNDPYPLLVVRPDGATAYGAALSAIAAYDADYGYEFVDADWDLEFPPTDPLLGQVMTHAVDQARARQQLLAKAAPRRYATRLRPGRGGGGSGSGSGGTDGEDDGDFDVLATGDGSGGRIGDRAGDGQFGGGTGQHATSGGTRGGSAGDDRYGPAGRGGESGDFADQFVSTAGSDGGIYGPDGSSAGEGQSITGQPGDGPSGGQPGGQPGAAGAPNGAAASGSTAGQTNNLATAGAGYSAGGSPNGNGAEQPPNVHAAPTNASSAAGPAGGGSSASATLQASSQRGSAAESRGVNWANASASQKSSAISRPIKLIVGSSEMALLPSGATSAGDATVVSFRQPTGKVLDQLALAVQDEIKGWGLAGQSMYWRPTLVLQIAPGAERQAARLAELLQDSGIDVRMPQTAARPAEGTYGR
jgi:hypothetical protein